MQLASRWHSSQLSIIVRNFASLFKIFTAKKKQRLITAASYFKFYTATAKSKSSWK